MTETAALHPLWILLAAWPILAACVLALVPAAHLRSSALTLALAGVVATLALIWRMPADMLARLGCVVPGAALVLRFAGLGGAAADVSAGRAAILPGFIAAGGAGLLAQGVGAAATSGLLGVQAACIGAGGLVLGRRARPTWEALLLDLCGAVLVLLAACLAHAGVVPSGVVPAGAIPPGAVSGGHVPGGFISGGAAPVLGAVGLAMLAGVGPRPAQESLVAADAAMFGRALLGLGVVIALLRGQVPVDGALMQGLGLLGLWWAVRVPEARALRLQIAPALVAAALPGGAVAALAWGILALCLGARADMPHRLAESGLPPWPGFVAVIWLVGACAGQGPWGLALAVGLAACAAWAACRIDRRSVRFGALETGLLLATFALAAVLEGAS